MTTSLSNFCVVNWPQFVGLLLMSRVYNTSILFQKSWKKNVTIVSMCMIVCVTTICVVLVTPVVFVTISHFIVKLNSFIYRSRNYMEGCHI